MSEVIGFALAWEECSYYGKRFTYNGLNMQGWEEAFKAKNRHDTICPKRFGFDKNMKKVDAPMEEIVPETIFDMIEGNRT